MREFAGGDSSAPFYRAFREAWEKATTVGQRNLRRLTEKCEPESELFRNKRVAFSGWHIM